ncbi:MAG: hypothetical protein ACLR8Y_08800 [Alistipes indistinctus]
MRGWVKQLEAMPDNFIHLEKPADDNFMAWYPAIQKQYGLTPSVQIESPDPFVMANLFTRDDSSGDLLLHQCAPAQQPFDAAGFPEGGDPQECVGVGSRQRRTLPPAAGQRGCFRARPRSGRLAHDRLRPRQQQEGSVWSPLPTTGTDSRTLTNWGVGIHHSLQHWIKTATMDTLRDLKDYREWKAFTGRVVYRNDVEVDDPRGMILNLGKVYGIAEVKVNGRDLGVSWYGRRIYDLSDVLHKGWNRIGSDRHHDDGQLPADLDRQQARWQHGPDRPGRPQPVQSMGMAGPATLVPGIMPRRSRTGAVAPETIPAESSEKEPREADSGPGQEKAPERRPAVPATSYTFPEHIMLNKTLTNKATIDMKKTKALILSLLLLVCFGPEPGRELQCVAVRHQIERYDDGTPPPRSESDRLHPTNRAAAAAGVLYVGRCLTGSIELKSNVTIPPQRRRRAACWARPARTTTAKFRHMAGPGPRQLKAEKLIGVTGRGVIDGQGRETSVPLHRPDPERRDQRRAEIRPSRFASDADLPARVQKRGDPQRNDGKTRPSGCRSRPV